MEGTSSSGCLREPNLHLGGGKQLALQLWLIQRLHFAMGYFQKTVFVNTSNEGSQSNLFRGRTAWL